MNKRELCSILQNQTVNPKRLKETQQMCSALLEEQMKSDLIPEERTNFWQFLSDVMRHTGWRLWVTQGILLLLVCTGIFSVPESPPGHSGVHAFICFGLFAILLPEHRLWDEGNGSRY